MEGSGSSNSQVINEVVSVSGKSEAEDPGHIRLAVFQENWTLA